VAGGVHEREKGEGPRRSIEIRYDANNSPVLVSLRASQLASV
jgi:hypothetical protein